jgi:hypothetical protein
MSTGLGLDLGAGLTKLARCGAASQAGGEQPAVRAVSTALVYGELSAEIPQGGPAACGRTADLADRIRCDGFADMLGRRTPEAVPAFAYRTPGEVTQDFLRCLLDDDDGQQDDPHGGLAPERSRLFPLVAAVQPAAGGPGIGPAGARSVAAELNGILTAMGRAPRRVIPSPLAALLYLRHARDDVAAAGRFVVCDVGAGSASLSLCRADEGRVRLVDSARVSADSVWAFAVRAGDVAGRRSPSLIEGLATMLASRGQAGPAVVADDLAIRRWRALEQVLGDPEQRALLDLVLSHASASPCRFGAARALRFDDQDATAAQVLDACAPLAKLCAAALAQLLDRQDDGTWRDAQAGRGGSARVALIGGLSCLLPVRAALLAAAGADAPDRVVELDDAERLGAVAMGAALVAAGVVNPGDRYPHGLRLPVHRQVIDRIEAGHIELARAGSIDLDVAQTRFVTEQGRPVLVTITAAADPDPARPLPVEVVPGGSGTPRPASFRPAQPPLPGVYRIGVCGGFDGAAVVLQHASGGDLLSYRIADPPPRPAGADGSR